MADERESDIYDNEVKLSGSSQTAENGFVRCPSCACSPKGGGETAAADQKALKQARWGGRACCQMEHGEVEDIACKITNQE